VYDRSAIVAWSVGVGSALAILAGVIAAVEGSAWRPAITAMLVVSALLVVVAIATAAGPVSSWIRQRLSQSKHKPESTVGDGPVSPLESDFGTETAGDGGPVSPLESDSGTETAGDDGPVSPVESEPETEIAGDDAPVSAAGSGVGIGIVMDDVVMPMPQVEESDDLPKGLYGLVGSRDGRMLLSSSLSRAQRKEVIHLLRKQVRKHMQDRQS
jgi:hypothetical protein